MAIPTPAQAELLRFLRDGPGDPWASGAGIVKSHEPVRAAIRNNWIEPAYELAPGDSPSSAKSFIITSTGKAALERFEMKKRRKNPKQRIYTVWKHSTNGRWFVSDGGAGAATSARGYKTAKEAEESAWDLIYRRGEDYPKANVVVEKSRTRKNPRGKHIACGDLSAKKCRQLQHVYESARERGYSKKRSAKQAWGAVEKNPARSAGPGKFDTMLDAAVYELSLHGGPDEEAGSVFEGGGVWYGLMTDGNAMAKSMVDLGIDINKDELHELRTEGEAGAIIRETSDGFVYIDYYHSKKSLMKDWENYSSEDDAYEENPLKAFDVFLNGKWYDTVYYGASSKVTADEVRRSLIDHDGYDPGITVRAQATRAKPKKRRGKNPSTKQLKSFLSR